MPLPKLTYRVIWFMEEPSCRLWRQRYFSKREEAITFMEGLYLNDTNCNIRIEILP